MTVFRVHTVDNPVSPRECWGVFVAERGDDGLTRERRVYGPANVLDCNRERARLISEERHGERIIVRGRVMRPDDPLAPDAFNGASGHIVKLLSNADKLPETVTRWLSMGRKITSVERAA